jgi:hypothetical protein
MIVSASIVPVPFISFWKNDQDVVRLPNLFKASDFYDRIDPVTWTLGAMKDKNERGWIQQIRGCENHWFAVPAK